MSWPRRQWKHLPWGLGQGHVPLSPERVALLRRFEECERGERREEEMDIREKMTMKGEERSGGGAGEVAGEKSGGEGVKVAEMREEGSGAESWGGKGGR